MVAPVAFLQDGPRSTLYRAGMPPTDLVAASVLPAAVAPISALIRAVDPARLDAPTPCADYAVRDLLNHLLFWGPVLAAAGRRETALPPAESEADVDLVVGDWPAALTAVFADVAEAWGDVGAWEGTTSMGGPEPLPASMVGGMAVGELVVHGWDLGRALDLEPTWAPDVLTVVHAEVAATAEIGREMGVYGASVPVPEEAPVLDRLLGLTGRDPHWTP
jgi:uncharacterized protein (TIGR03086 family)